MSVIHGHRCDGCNVIDEKHADDGPPQGWFLVARMDSNGSWTEETEWHLCSAACLNEWTWGDDDAATVHHEELSHTAFPGCCEQGGAE